jgi:protein ImuB
MPALVEHLRARLGVEAVYGIRLVSEHRPENAWRVAEPVLEREPAPDAGETLAHRPFGRPPWLLSTPRPLDAPRGRPCHDGPLELLSAPERIESGWWDGGDRRRDYYVARNPQGARLWIYCEFAGEDTRRWFLQGIFG